VITPFVEVVEPMLRAEFTIKGTVVHERLVAEHGFTGSYQRLKMFLAEARPRIAAELAEDDVNPLTGLHRWVEVIAGAQGQVDWGDEGDVLAHVGIEHVYSFHLTLSYSRDPFCCFTTSMDMATFWDCHRRAFAHLVAFEASWYSVPARRVRAGQRVQLQADGPMVRIRALPPDGGDWHPSPGHPAGLLGDRPRPLGRAARRTHPRHHP
jgi:hypothetical protein